MEEQHTGAPEDFARLCLRYTKERFSSLLSQTEDYVREKPAQSLLCAFAAGFILDRLPLGQIAGRVFRLAAFALKPAILIYGATKVYQALEDQK